MKTRSPRGDLWEGSWMPGMHSRASKESETLDKQLWGVRRNWVDYWLSMIIQLDEYIATPKAQRAYKVSRREYKAMRQRAEAKFAQAVANKLNPPPPTIQAV